MDLQEENSNWRVRNDVVADQAEETQKEAAKQEMAARFRAAQTAAYQEEIARQNAELQLTAVEIEAIEAELAPLLSKEAELKKKIGSWKSQYILLFTGAALVDGITIILYILGSLIPPLIFISETISAAYSVIRYWMLERINKGAPKNESWMRNIRTIGVGLVKLIPVIGAVPLQSWTMMTEYYIKKTSVAKIESELRQVRAQIRALRA